MLQTRHSTGWETAITRVALTVRNRGKFSGRGKDTCETESTGSPGGDRQSHGEDDEPDSMASPKPSSLGAAQMNNLDMQGETGRRRDKKLETQEEKHRTRSLNKQSQAEPQGF